MPKISTARCSAERSSPGPDHGETIAPGRSPVAGLMSASFNLPSAGPPTFLTVGIGATVAKLAAAGGSSCLDPMEVPGKGSPGLAVDPSGAAFGYMAAAAAPRLRGDR